MPSLGRNTLAILAGRRSAMPFMFTTLKMFSTFSTTTTNSSSITAVRKPFRMPSSTWPKDAPSSSSS